MAAGLASPVDDLTASLPRVAVKLCAAARRLLAEGGYSALTIDAVAREAGEYKASVAYYFGSKAGLLAAVADSLTPRDACAATLRATQEHPPGPDRVRAQMTGLMSMSADRESFTALYALLPRLLTDEELRGNMAALYDWYRRLDVLMCGVKPDSSQAADDLYYLGAAIVACVDGLALQALLDPERFDLAKAYGVLERLFAAYLESEFPDQVHSGRSVAGP